MPTTINFLSAKQKQIAKREKVDKIVCLVVVIILLVVAGVYGGVYYWGRKVTEEGRLAQADLDQVTAQIRQTTEQEAAYLSFYDKVKKLELLLEKRSHGTNALVETYYYLTTPSTAITNTTYDYYTKTIELTLMASSAFGVETLRSLLQAKEFQELYTQVQMNTLSRSGTGSYQMQVVLTL
jgi:hypothetical protein